jgi:hypothetical protein
VPLIFYVLTKNFSSDAVELVFQMFDFAVIQMISQIVEQLNMHFDRF